MIRLLRRFNVWPFDPPQLPLILEIYPRLFYASTRRNDPEQRLAVLDKLGIESRIAAASEDAFDAAVSAVIMSHSVGEILTLKRDRHYVLEGRIWEPSGKSSRH